MSKNLAALLPGIKYGHRVFPNELLDGGVGGPMVKKDGNYWFVDGTDGNDNNDGLSIDEAKATIQAAITAASAYDTIYILPKTITDATGDPTSYEENLTIPFTHVGLSLIGISRGLTQGGLPQLKDGSTTTQHILRLRAPGCLIANLGFNGAGNTAGGILLDDDASTKAAWGTSILNCHFKNCKGTTATNAATGGAINFSSTGNSWQCRFAGNRFYKNVGDIVLPGTSNTVPQDIVIEDNIFSGPAANVDCNLYLQGAGSGINGVIIRRNTFTAMPAIGSGTNVRFIHATGCVGVLAENTFACVTESGGTELTFGAAGTGAYIPTTLLMANNHGEIATADTTGEIYRT